MGKTSLHSAQSASSSFNPLSVSGCKLWLKSDVGITKDGSDLVSAWEDQSGESNDTAQATGTKQPLWVDNAYASKPTIRFDGVDNDLLKTTFTAGELTQPTTIFIVCTFPSTNSENAVFGGGTSDKNCSIWRTINNYRMYAGIQVGSITSSTAFAQFTLLFNTTSSTLRRNKTSLETGMNVGIEPFQGICLGGLYGTIYFGDTDISEMLVYTGNISSANVTLIEDYLSDRWGL